MTKNKYEENFRDHPEEILVALHAIKSIAAQFSDESITGWDKTKWDSILFHVIKAHGVTMIMSNERTYQ
ncbi:MAG TPA: hypothetical protein VEC36_08815 [Patescibacteria group bacterium]|nr:hypothetical protein [Patescibacteria group bacterium]